MRIFVALALALACWDPSSAIAAKPPGAPPDLVPDAPLRRTILALYDSSIEQEPAVTRIHRYAEAPLNHLGLTVIFRDIQRELPPPDSLSDVRGVLTWFSRAVPEPQDAYVRWATAMVEQGSFFAILGDPGFRIDLRSPDQANLGTPFTSKLGFVGSGRYSPGPHGIQIIEKVSSRVEYERLLTGPLPGYLQFRAVGNGATSYLSVQLDGDAQSRSDLVVIGDRGGMAASGYEIYDDTWLGYTQWRIDPFVFFRSVFRTDDLPKPDPSTLAGGRLFYAHVDGDGWREATRIPGYEKKVAICAEVIYDAVLRRFPGIPITVAPIAADLDDGWVGSKRARAIGERIFALPNVEAGSHTLSHPFLWKQYRNGTGGKPALAELAGASDPAANDDGAANRTSTSERSRHLIELGEAMSPPFRAYVTKPFDLAGEVGGSVALLNDLIAPRKHVAVFTWSGDARPFEEALAAVHAAGLPNINGGSNGFFQPYPTLTSVSPIGLRVGSYFQVYAGNAMESSYTNRHPDRVPGPYHFSNVLQGTETPMRLRPFEVYWHMYSALHSSSLNGVISQLDLAQTLDLVPVPTSTYARIATGFVSTRLVRVGAKAWRIDDRSDLSTIRFDDAVSSTVDFAKSQGVVGQRHYQGSLYVYLDASATAPVVALGDNAATGAPAASPRPFLVQSRWPIRDLIVDGGGFEFSTQGFGVGDMLWHVPQPGEYAVAARANGRDVWRATAAATEGGLLRLMPPIQASWARIRIDERPADQAARP